MEPALSQIIEAIIFVSDQPVKVSFLQQVLRNAVVEEDEVPSESLESDDHSGPSAREIEEALEELEKKYQDIQYPFEIKKVAGGYQFYTKRSFYPYIRKAVVSKNQRRLTRSALETLSIVAYRQPITKTEVEHIRGVNCDYAMQKLLEKNLLSIVGRADAPGRPLLYGTSSFFMEYFGIADLSDLPKLKEFAETEEDQMDQFRIKQQAETNETEAGEEQTVLERGDQARERDEEAASQDLEQTIGGSEGEEGENP
ncbi:MAG: SMC-Scp complex subunit ScpB [Bacteroidia bacterium]|nr:SMC-Scp complex subunit ScpB [Bacteroidia bacterium]